VVIITSFFWVFLHFIFRSNRLSIFQIYFQFTPSLIHLPISAFGLLYRQKWTPGSATTNKLLQHLVELANITEGWRKSYFGNNQSTITMYYWNIYTFEIISSHVLESGYDNNSSIQRIIKIFQTMLFKFTQTNTQCSAANNLVRLFLIALTKITQFTIIYKCTIMVKLYINGINCIYPQNISGRILVIHNHQPINQSSVSLSKHIIIYPVAYKSRLTTHQWTLALKLHIQTSKVQCNNGCQISLEQSVFTMSNDPFNLDWILIQFILRAASEKQ